jgi:hypothetical protein
MTKSERRYFAGYVIIASALMILIVLAQSFRYRLFGTTLLLGWDSPSYVWTAKDIIAKGPINMIVSWGFPYFYSLLLAFFGYLIGDVVIVERILPLLFGVVLILANSELVFRITKNVHTAGLAAVLSAISINVLRLVSDLHRNLMVLSLSMIALLLVPNIEERRSFINKAYLSFILLLFAIAITQIETYFILSLSLVLYEILTKNLKKLCMFILACAIPTAVLVPLFSKFFFGYFGSLTNVQYPLSVSAALLWTGGSWITLGFLIVGSFLFFKSKLRNNKLVSLIFSWCLVLLALISLIGAGIVHLPADFAYRSMIIFPIPVLLAFAAEGCNYFINHHQRTDISLSTQKRRSFRAIFRRSLPLLIAFFLIGGSALLTIQYVGGFLTPYIPRSGYEKIMETKQFLAGRYQLPPIFVFRGDPPIWFANLYRNYLGAEIGEHFAYYGDTEKLFQLVHSKPEINYNPYLHELEESYITSYFNEMLGNFSGPPPPMFVHDTYITNVTELISHPIVIITPEFYNEEIPYCLKPFYIEDGIYIIPPHSQINFSKVSYGPEITVIRNNIRVKMNSTILYIDPEDPSIVHLSVNASQGYTSYNFTDLPSSWTFQNIEQGGDISFPEVNPRRVNGTKAVSGNDPADSIAGWSSPWPEQEATLEIDTSIKKEGYASLIITGRTDSWGDLGVRYNSSGTWNLSGYSSISVWAKSNESTTFSISLIDSSGRTRTFWSLEAGGSSATTSWKRFAANLTEYTSQTSGFNISAVDSIDLYVYSNVKKSMTLLVDDLTVDTALNLKQSVYKDRVPVDETVVAYFYTHLEDPQLVHTAYVRNPVDNGVTADSPSSPDVCIHNGDRIQQTEPPIVYSSNYT